MFDAIVLAGGRSSRLGGTPKAGLRFRGSSLLAATVASAVSRGARRVVVVGAADVADVAADVAYALESSGAQRARPGVPGAGEPADGDRERIVVAREEPAFGGPAAGIAAGFAALAGASGGQEDSDFVLVLACDLPEVDGAVGALLAAVGEYARLDQLDAVRGADGIVAVDDEGRQQHLLAMYRTAALATIVARHRAAGDLDGLPVRRLVDGLNVGVAEVPRGSADDVDTWADAARHGIEGAVVPGADTDAREPKGWTPDDQEQGVVLDRWVARLAAGLGLDGLEVDIEEVLGLAGVAAHAVRRPAAPLTTFVVGYAAGLAVAADGADAAAAATRAGEVARRLAAAYAAEVASSDDGTADVARET
ncbi:Molybdopterin-guanine dinucleotide biosynthesis protein A [Herbiconiux ginsengi]|uniref:Molybdopterin-guanine dinucleotide biosynthesis protein A n=1 Tax=Herbiconiux ginsengi TaxID=381665 RepID=A0A1H3KBZ9_9MICO|nr:Molybdopterin-guanine dinucleotide biosynthesis protein A [Herbiconiux ginsengi]